MSEEFEILAVVVNRLPKWCGDCMFLHEVFCTLDGNRNVGRFSETPPSWCPLTTKDKLLKQVASPFASWEEESEEE